MIEIAEQCPNCGRIHIKGDRKETHCGCGKDLVWIVPIFKQSKSGYLLVKKDKIHH